MADRFYIGPYDSESGQDTSLKPFMIPENAFEQLTNAYVFRGRVRKRFGSRLFDNSQISSRLRMTLTPAVLTVTTPSNIAVGQMLSIGSDLFTVNDIAFPVALLSTTAVTAQLVAADQVTFSAIASTVFWYPALPVMGLLTREVAGTSINREQTIAFDTQFAYQYVTSPMGWERLNTETVAGDALWGGSNSQFFWTTTWRGASTQDLVFFVTNFNENEARGMRSLFGSTWSSFNPAITSTTNLNTARILVNFKNRLVALNTYEGAAVPGTHFPFRARYSGVGSPLATNAWRQDIPGNGNAIDAPTTEAIVSAEFVKDRLIVFFERSTWELVFTGNQIFPFQWQQINTELGVESTFSIVPFDKVAIGVGNVGVHACNGSNVERIDQKIPDSVFDIHNANEGVSRVYGIRDYTVEMVYWTFPGTDTTSSFPYPTRALIYNYATGTWAFNDDSITCFGYFQPQSGITWDSTTITWDSDISWDSGELQADFRQVVAGNQEGYTFIIDPDSPTNAPLLEINDLSVATGNVITLSVVNHNLRQGDFVRLSGIVDDGGAENLTLLNNVIFQVNSFPTDPASPAPNAFDVIFTDDDNTVIAGTYNGGGLVSRVSNITLLTKQYNFYAQKGRNFRVDNVNFLVDKTFSGETTVNYFTSTSQTNLVDNDLAALGDSTLEMFPLDDFPYEANATQLWRPVYFNAGGSYIQFELKMSTTQMLTATTDADGNRVAPSEEDFELHAMVISASPTSTRLQ